MDDESKEFGELASRAKSNTHQIDEIKKRLDKDEDKLNDMNSQILVLTNMSDTLNRMQSTMDDNNERYIATFEHIANTLVSISTSIGSTDTKVAQVSTELEKVADKQEQMSKRIDQVDNKDSFHIIPYVKKNFIVILIAIGAIYALFLQDKVI